MQITKTTEAVQQHFLLQSVFEKIAKKQNFEGISQNQFQILQAILQTQNHTQNYTIQTIANKLSCSLPALTQNINKMVINKLIKRENSLTDRRKIVLSITDIAQDKIYDYTTMKQAVNKQIETVFERLSPSELDTMTALYQKLLLCKKNPTP